MNTTLYISVSYEPVGNIILSGSRDILYVDAFSLPRFFCDGNAFNVFTYGTILS